MLLANSPLTTPPARRPSTLLLTPTTCATTHPPLHLSLLFTSSPRRTPGRPKISRAPEVRTCASHLGQGPRHPSPSRPLEGASARRRPRLANYFQRRTSADPAGSAGRPSRPPNQTTSPNSSPSLDKMRPADVWTRPSPPVTPTIDPADPPETATDLPDRWGVRTSLREGRALHAGVDK